MTLRVPFLTDLDSRGDVKGSRDPLGVQAIWTHFGRKVVGNLTTVSSSLRGFTTTLLGYQLAELAKEHRSSSESTLSVFLKVEQLAAYSRLHVKKDGDFRGIDRVKATLADGPEIVISSNPSHQILTDQKTYGLWGLYSVPARRSGLVMSDEPALVDTAKAFVASSYTHRLERLRERKYDALLDALAGATLLSGHAGARRRAGPHQRAPASARDVAPGHA